MFKKYLIISAVALTLNSATVLAADNIFDTSGFYFGGQAGVSDLGYQNSDYLLPKNSVDDTQFGARAYAGYAFVPYFATELGYTYYGQPKFKVNNTDLSQTITQQGLDLDGKVTFALAHGFGFYAKAGLGLIFRSALDQQNQNFINHDADSSLIFLTGVGLTYSFTKNFAFDLAWNRTFSSGSLPAGYFYAAGFIIKLDPK